MRPLLQNIDPLARGSMFIKEIKTSNLNDQFHFHNVHEIALILKGNGKRIVGDSIEHFTDGDLVIMAPSLPHVTYSGNDYFLTKNYQEVHALVIYFNPDWFDEDILSSTDFISLIKLIKNTERGIEILGDTKMKAIKALIKLKNSRGLERMIRFLDILDFVSKSDEYKYLASEGYSNSYAQNNLERLGEVYKFIMENFTDTIKLSDVSCIANMTPTAFCKYFKSKTGKTFSDFINEVRISHACKLFLDINLTASEVCYSCGFNNLTSFNNNFKRFTKMTPTEYKKKLHF